MAFFLGEPTRRNSIKDVFSPKWFRRHAFFSFYVDIAKQQVHVTACTFRFPIDVR